jgi:hypothetical protein
MARHQADLPLLDVVGSSWLISSKFHSVSWVTGSAVNRTSGATRFPERTRNGNRAQYSRLLSFLGPGGLTLAFQGHGQPISNL